MHRPLTPTRDLNHLTPFSLSIVPQLPIRSQFPIQRASDEPFPGTQPALLLAPLVQRIQAPRI